MSWVAGTLLWFAPVGSAQQVLELTPNLQPLPASNVSLVGGTTLRFSTTSWNNGAGPLELRAGETDPVGNRQNVYQRVYLSDGGFYDRLAGIFVWHPEHSHFHFEDYAIYTLQPFDAPGGSQRTSSKTTFCVMDTTMINTSLPGAPGSRVYETCGATIQGMSVGWGDTYASNLPGQSINFTGNPSGDYKLIIEIDPKKRLIESSEEDNISCVLLRINVADSSVNILNNTGCDGAPGGEAVVSSIAPSSALRGSLATVTITGSGFATGMLVSFENGSGPRPTASNVTVVDAHTITANVTVAKGGGGRDRVWDVRVGSGVLLRGFTVQ
jgi:lysyl oxidase